jgi:hypothetical protein
MASLSKRAIAIRTALGAAVAAVLMVLFVLPAELGVDPTGFGKATGLTELSREAKLTELQKGQLRGGSVVSFSGAPVKTDHWTFELGPFKSIEFKYTMGKGAGMLFHWQATGPLHYDMHSHPFAGGVDFTESYAVGDARQQQGTYVAPFSGIHGWYWQNQSMDNVTLTLDATGGFSESAMFDEYGEHKRPIEPVE